MLQLWPDGSGRILILGTDIMNGMKPQAVIPKGVWQGAKLIKDGKFALLGTTVSPGFEFFDYEFGHREELVKSYPKFREWIIALTRQ
jgi:predicted cupin superfamily sugar epimerase